MKIKLSHAYVAAFAAIALLAPTLASATLSANTEIKTEANGSVQIKPVASDFCSTITSRSSQITSKVTAAQNGLAAKQAQRLADEQMRQTAHQQELTKLRAQADADRVAMYAQLAAKATTTAQSLAVAAFKATIEPAVTARRAAVDAAIQTYWPGVASVLAARQAAVKTAEDNLATAIQAAIATATTECATPNNSTVAKAHFTASVKAANTQFMTDRKAIDKASTQIKALATTRKTAVDKAINDFKKIAEGARVTLKAALAVK